MNPNYPTLDEPATPEHVLAVFQDMHREQCQHDPEADLSAVLTPETTVAEWRAACDLVRWRELGQAHNQVWGITCSDAEWGEVLEPASQRRLSGVCRLIAQHARRRRVRPALLFGRSCTTAGVFLTIRSLLHQAGEPAGEIRPSTPLGPYARRNPGVFLGPISRLAPGALPPVRIRTPFYDAAIWGLVTGMVGLTIGVWLGWPVFTILGVVLSGMCYGLSFYAARCLPPSRVEFGELRSFRDLANAIAEHAQPNFMV